MGNDLCKGQSGDEIPLRIQLYVQYSCQLKSEDKSGRIPRSSRTIKCVQKPLKIKENELTRNTKNVKFKVHRCCGGLFTLKIRNDKKVLDLEIFKC